MLTRRHQSEQFARVAEKPLLRARIVTGEQKPPLFEPPATSTGKASGIGGASLKGESAGSQR